MGNFIDRTGQRFGRLTVVRRAEDYVSPKGEHSVQWLCKCDCGNEKKVIVHSLTQGFTTSCGCYNKERLSETHRKHNSWELFMTTNIAVGTDSNGNKFTIDIEDWVKCKDYYWWADNTGYIMAYMNGKFKLLHRYVMNCPDDKVVDHINGVKSLNCKSNLRICTQQQNNMNRCTNKNNTSGHKGVYWSKEDNRWIAQITYKKNDIKLGYFTDIEEAAKARQEAEKKYFGEYTRGVV